GASGMNLNLDNQLLSEFPLAALTDDLLTISARGNQLSTIPDALWQHTQIERLSIGENHFREIPGEIGKLHSLKELFLDGNPLNQVPDTLGQLSQLKILD